MLVVQFIHLDETPRLNQLIVLLYISIENLQFFITPYIDDVVIHEAKYPSDALITVTPLSYINVSWKYA